MNLADAHFVDVISTCLNGSRIQSRNGNSTQRTLLWYCWFRELPLITLRKCFWKGALREMEWFLSGSNNINDLHPSIRHWWMPWANREGFIPANYSEQFRDSYGRHGSCDQVQYLLKGIRDHPFSRRNVLTLWNTSDMMHPDTPISNCHGTMIQCFTEPDNSLHMKMYQRSCDVMLGMTHNWVQYWALLTWLAHRSGRTVGSLNWEGGDVHIYEDHLEEAGNLVKRYKEVEGSTKSYSLIYNPTSEDFLADDFSLDREYKYLTDTKLRMVV